MSACGQERVTYVMSKLQLGIYGTKARRRERRNVNLVALKHNNRSKQIAIDQISKRQ